MCLIAFAIEADPGCPLLIASNRDEFFDRPTAPLHRWALPNGVEVVAGRDLRDGGTWLGVNALGRVAMLTNVRGAELGAAARSRGELANRWLSGELDWPALLASLSPADYGGFNLVVGDALSGVWGWVSNRNPAHPHSTEVPTLHNRRLAPGLYGLSNATLDTAWPKTLRLKQALAEALAQPSAEDAQARLIQALGDGQPAPLHALPKTGVPEPLEQALSSPFVHIPANGYGTRTSLLVRATRTPPSKGGSGWGIQLDEWTHGSDARKQPAWREEHHQAVNLTW
jgi:uncharacterized protein with NRDE domain